MHDLDRQAGRPEAVSPFATPLSSAAVRCRSRWEVSSG